MFIKQILTLSILAGTALQLSAQEQEAAPKHSSFEVFVDDGFSKSDQYLQSDKAKQDQKANQKLLGRLRPGETTAHLRARLDGKSSLTEERLLKEIPKETISDQLISPLNGLKEKNKAQDPTE
ncbi:hypothetical protein PPO43_07020 [Saprospira sp. CCB-QB6]|uniref:hypothetical protein n=1 Tax=Saprospira sp. CCB-QB6 TaxID=3023936 RepID=UPI00234B8DD9|nr:hypothetical protein [Saprospira sp. CCB-QB6]WCL82839.1 hypothetical protein PPO43_07020 [Saprospira sp. CCB-QB6]